MRLREALLDAMEENETLRSRNVELEALVVAFQCYVG